MANPWLLQDNTEDVLFLHQKPISELTLSELHCSFEPYL
jgi:hypothetical protein